MNTSMRDRFDTECGSSSIAFSAPPMTTIRPVINITRRCPKGRTEKVARVTFPDTATPLDVVATMHRWPATEGFHCDLRQHGPQGYSLPLDRAAYFAPFPGLAQHVAGLAAP